jgi:UDP-GlcNAc:undecaprenyl-phosphate GlcNAc-1-phosphate transferase
MYSLGLVAAASFLITYFLTPWVRAWFVRRGWVDKADGERKIHSLPIPRSGGVIIACAYLASYAILAVLHLHGWAILHLDLGLVFSVLPATAIVFVIGLVDDVKGLRALTKLIGQIVASLVAFIGGLHVSALHWHALGGWWLSLPLTLFWLLLCTNAFNFIDGVDGLSSGLGLCATLTLICAALLSHNFPLLLATVPLAGALIGFLLFNFNPASVYLGDSGSYLVGFLLGCYSIVWSQKSATMLGLLAPLMAFSVPLFDVTLVVLRRFLRAKSIFSADRLHIHHRLLERGFAPRQVVLVLCSAGGIAAALALLSTMNNMYAGFVLLLFCGVSWFGIKNLRYQEVCLASRIASPAAFRQSLLSETILQTTREHLKAADTPGNYWKVVKTMASELGFCRVWMTLESVEFFESVDTDDSIPSWTITIPLDGGGHIGLAHRFEKTITVVTLASLTDLLRTCLVPGTVHRPGMELVAALPPLRKAASGKRSFASSPASIR